MNHRLICRKCGLAVDYSAQCRCGMINHPTPEQIISLPIDVLMGREPCSAELAEYLRDQGYSLVMDHNEYMTLHHRGQMP